jgi:hypothetical protein
VSAMDPLESVTKATVHVPAAPRSPVPVSAVRAPVIKLMQVALTRSVPMAVYRFNRIGRSGVAGVSLILFAGVFLYAAVLPQYRAISALREEIGEAQRHGPTDFSPRVRLNRFADNLPKRSELPRIAGQIFKLAASAGVTLDRGRYELAPLHSGHLARYRMTFPIKGPYPGVRQFIDATLNAIPSAAVDGFRIERKAAGDANVEADLRFSIFVRNES